MSQRLRDGDDGLDHGLECVFVDREPELARLDLRQVEDIVDEREQMLAVRPDVLQDLLRLVRHVAVDAVEKHLRVAENRIQRRAELVAHVGQELRLVLAGDLELPALLLDLPEQPGILDREHRLVGEGLHQVDCPSRELRLLPAHEHERAEDPIGPDERDDEDAPDPAPTAASLSGHFGRGSDP